MSAVSTVATVIDYTFYIGIAFCMIIVLMLTRIDYFTKAGCSAKTAHGVLSHSGMCGKHESGTPL